jgi:photosystem II stability/assembly factor-like uncharacterized protein
MYKKIYLMLAFFGFFSLGITHAQWIIEKSPCLNNLNAVCFTDDKTGWIVGDKGTILSYKNNCWIEYKKLTTQNLCSVFMVDKNDVWAVGSKGTILHFNGQEWENVISPTTKNLYSVSFIDHDNGIAVGAWGTILVYENGSWSLINKGIRGNLYTVSKMIDQFVLGGGLQGYNIPVMKMENNPEKTLISTFNPYVEIGSLACTGQKNIWAIGQPGTIFHFDGKNWLQQETYKKIPPLNFIYFSSENTGISVGYEGTILIYTGKDWIKQNSQINLKLNGAAISGNIFYAVGDSGTILSKKPVNDLIASDAPKNIINIDVYPNPSNETLNFTIPDMEDFSANLITITNSYGQIVMQIKTDPGIQNRTFHINISALKNGLHMLKAMSPNGKVATAKFIVKH